MSEHDKEEFDELWSKARELSDYVNTLIESIGTLFQQEEYDTAVKMFGIHFKADLYFTDQIVSHSRYGSVMSIIDAIASPEDFAAEQKRRSEEFNKC